MAKYLAVFLIALSPCIGSTSDFHTYCILEDGEGGDPVIQVTFAPDRGVLFEIHDKVFFVDSNQLMESKGDEGGSQYRIPLQSFIVAVGNGGVQNTQMLVDIQMVLSSDRFDLHLRYSLAGEPTVEEHLFCFEGYPQF